MAGKGRKKMKKLWEKFKAWVCEKVPGCYKRRHYDDCD
jgi:hypothetical protein